MRIVLQRVSKADLFIDQKCYASIEQGLVVLLGITNEDSEDDIKWLVKKILNMRIFSDDEGKMNLSIQDILEGGILIVSQFTLFASTKKGNRPSYLKSAKPDIAIPLYEQFIEETKAQFPKVTTGIFGADMQIN
ncbi:UNVERIFIED_CONTAM: hypothetical protein GTU68_065475, partial [Idotea baltica]|nr:hypothetical protein [Idotea baltica]